MEISLKGIKISIPIFQFRSIQPDFIPCNIRKYENTPLVRSRRLALACRSRGSTLSSFNSRTCSLFRPGFEFLISNFLFVVIFLAFFKISVFTIFVLRKEKTIYLFIDPSWSLLEGLRMSVLGRIVDFTLVPTFAFIDC